MIGIKCKDYHIISIRVHASNYLLKKWNDTGGHLPRQHWERTELHNDFIWKFIEKVTGKDRGWWHKEYMMSSRECAFEYLYEKFDIFTMQHGGHEQFLIPKKGNKELFDWMKDNINNPHRVLKRVALGLYGIKDHMKSTWQRDMAKEFTKKWKEKHER